MKYFIYIDEIIFLFLLSCFEALIESRYFPFLMPLLISPMVVLTAFTSLLLVTYLASKRKIVKIAPSGLYSFEDLVVALDLAISMPILLAGYVLLKLIIPLLSLNSLHLFLVTLFCVGVTIILYYILRNY
ncbi:MAG: hypothetical protein B6U69_04185 [Thermofilum sp. ex4484_15]|nr:MAG: hypothetical protein B6U69_04185 [Thermofilum sp. ex4484_15]